MVNWDRGFDAHGNLVWGPAAGGYRFRRVGEADACVQPVRMLVYAEIRRLREGIAEFEVLVLPVPQVPK
jgi:hypothetical protein